MTPSNRPRIEGDREEEILDATLTVLLDMGYDRLTMDAVARQARAGKATLYRRWETKASLVVDALIRAKHAPSVEEVDTGTLRGDLIATFCGGPGADGHESTHALGAVVTALNSDPEFAERFRTEFIAPKVAVTTAIYDRAQQRGEIHEDLDLEVIGPALAGVLLHRAFVMGEVTTDDVVHRVVDHLILPAVLAAPRSPSTDRSREATP